MKKNVLLVEDDPALRMVVREILKDDFNIDEADNGDDAISKGLNSNADLIILDYHLPKKDGLEVIAAVKKEHPELPVIVLTGYLSPESEKKFNSLGASKIFPKPFNYRTLLEAVIALVKSPSSHAIQAPETSKNQSSNQTAYPVAPSAQMLHASLNALATLAEKTEFLQTITEKYWIEPNDIASIRETARLMDSEIRKFYGTINQALFELGDFRSPVIESVNKPCLQGDN